jgi:hypothetical protein
MGEVYRARDTRLDRSVAIKILSEAFLSDADRLQRFQQEARILSSLNHPNLLAIFDVGSQDGSHYLVSELLEGKTLRERLSEGPLSLRKAVEYGVQMANGLAAAHEKGIVFGEEDVLMRPTIDEHSQDTKEIVQRCPRTKETMNRITTTATMAIKTSDRTFCFCRSRSKSSLNFGFLGKFSSTLISQEPKPAREECGDATGRHPGLPTAKLVSNSRNVRNPTGSGDA